MPIPSQNEFLLPFLNLLSDGQTLTRSQLLFRLAQHFNISEEVAQQMSGNQFTLVSRVAWCDIHLVKAGFVKKSRDPHDSLQDEFRITPQGQHQLRNYANQISVGYLQQIYGGRVYRGSGADDTTSPAEVMLYEQMENLPEQFTVIHSVKWITHETKHGTVGEADFIIAHPNFGILIMEVKGGEVWMEREGNHTQWYSRSQSGHVHKISDACSQTDRNRRNMGDWLRESPITNRYRYAIFPAIALPDTFVTDHIRPDCTMQMILDKTRCEDLSRALLEVYDYWRDHADFSNQQMDGQPAIDALIDLVVPSRKLRPRVSEIFERERRKIEELTRQQFRILRSLRRHRRAAIVGGAGTGKTMLAMEKAQELAESGFKVLFLCYNRNIVGWIASSLQDEKITVATYHSFVGTIRNLAGLRDAHSMGWDEFTEAAPDLLLDAAHIIREQMPDRLFDAIIVDEAQDFDDSMWIPIPDLLKDPEHGVLYVFFDDNQRLYTQISNIPMERDPFYLVENCRNTQAIHTALIRYAISDDETFCDGPEGRPIEVIPASNPASVRKVLQQVLHRLTHEDGVSSDDIIVLTPQSERRSQWKSDQQMGNCVLTWDMKTEMNLAIRVCTIYSFKGLESAVIILTELDKLRDDIRNQLLYVALSRARSHVIVVGELPSPTTATMSVD